MATKGSLVKFVYLRTGAAPENPEENTIYFAPESNSIYVGSIPIINGVATESRFDVVEAKLEQLSEEIPNIVIEGEGALLVDAKFDTSTNTLTLTRGDKDDKIRWEVI